MNKIKKIHKITIFFLLIFLLGIYSFTLYINNTIDQKKETVLESEIPGSGKLDREVIQVN